MVERGNIYCFNTNHVDQYNNSVINEGSFEKPCMIDQASYRAFSPDPSSGTPLGSGPPNVVALAEKARELDWEYP